MFWLPGLAVVLLLWNLLYAHGRGRLLHRAVPILALALGGYALPPFLVDGCGTVMVGAVVYIGSLLSALGLVFYLMWQANQGQAKSKGNGEL